MRILLLIVSLLSGVWAVAGIVSEDAENIQYRQSDGTSVTLSKLPKRVVICNGSFTQLWYASGGEAVGIIDVPSKGTLPEAARNLPIVGSRTAPNPEKILVLKPDLVLLSDKHERHKAAADMLNRSGVETVLLEYDDYFEFAELLDLFSRLNGSKESARTEIKRITGEIDAICMESKAQSTPTTAIVFAAAAGFKLESEQSSTGIMLKMLGAKNIAAALKQPRMNFSYEQLFVDDPEVIFVVTMGNTEALKEKFRKEIMSQEAWKGLAAAKAGRVHFLPSELFLYQAGMRYPEAFRILATLLHPVTEGGDK